MLTPAALVHRVRTLAHEAPLLVLGGLYTLGFFLFVLFHRRTPTNWGAIAYAQSFVPLNLLSAWALSRASQRPLFDPQIRRALTFIALGIVMVSVGNVVWYIETGVLGREEIFGWADLPYLSFYPFAFYGLLQFPRRQHRPQERWKLLLDGAIVVIGLTVLVWSAVVRLILPVYGDANLAALGVAYPLADVGTLALVTDLTFRGRPGATRNAFRLLLLGLAVNAFADLAYQVVYIQTHGATPDWTDSLYIVSYLCIIASGEDYRRRPVLPEAPQEEPLDDTHRPSNLPLYVVAVLGLLLCTVAAREFPSSLSVLALGLVVLAVLLMVREGLVVRENARLLEERTTRQSETRFAALVRHSSDLVLLVDADGVVRFASPAVFEVLGRGLPEVSGLPFGELLHPDDRARGEQFLVDVTLRPGASGTIRWRLHHAAGEWRSLETVASNLLSEPEVAGVVLNSRDLTERELLEEQLRQAQKMEAIGRLAGGVAHDFNNLLTTVLASAELALANIPAGDPVRADLEEIRHSATRAAALTGQLLAFSRKQLIEPDVHDLRRVVEETGRMLSRLLGSNIRLEADLADPANAVRVDRSQMEQILLNLAANARDAMPHGGLLHIRVRNQELAQPLATRFMAVPPGRYVLLEVEDTGAGMDQATLLRVFEPFFTTKRLGQGTGLGLASVYGIVRQNGAYITVDSTPGAGTRFRIYFPRVETPVAPAVAARPIPTTVGHETILLVEDEPALLNVARRILSAAGYQVLAAANAEEAQAALGRFPGEIDLMLTDVIMPGASGPMLADRLRRRWPGLRVLFMSGYPGTELGAHGVLDADTDLLQKPFTAHELLLAVQEALAAPRPAGPG